jgi:hypothetical protein
MFSAMNGRAALNQRWGKYPKKGTDKQKEKFERSFRQDVMAQLANLMTSNILAPNQSMQFSMGYLYDDPMLDAFSGEINPYLKEKLAEWEADSQKRIDRSERVHQLTGDEKEVYDALSPYDTVRDFVGAVKKGDAGITAERIKELSKDVAGKEWANVYRNADYLRAWLMEQDLIEHMGYGDPNAPEHTADTGKVYDPEAEKYPFFEEGVHEEAMELGEEAKGLPFVKPEEFEAVVDEFKLQFEQPGKKVVAGAEAKKQGGFIPMEEAQARVDEWKAEAARQGKGNGYNPDNFDKTILSLFDYTGEWAKPWAEAGYNVIMLDLQGGYDVNDFSAEYFYENFDIKDVYGILAACPCTDFTTTGNYTWRGKDADGRTVASQELVWQTMRTVEFWRPVFWALENPIGRIRS